MPRLSRCRLLPASILLFTLIAGCHLSDSHCNGLGEISVVNPSAAIDDKGACWGCGVNLEGTPKTLPSIEPPSNGPRVPVYVGEPPASPTSQPAPEAKEVQQLPELPPPHATKDSRSGFPRAPLGLPRKSYGDITAHSSFGHAPDYAWISGEAQKLRNEWRLRYAAIDDPDPFGGSVKLAGQECIDKLKDGEQYKLNGRLFADDVKTPGAVFYISSVEPLGH